MMTVRRDFLPAFAVLGIIGLGVPPATPAAEGAPQAGAPASAPLSPSEAPQRMTVPEGFKVTLCAAEPDVVQPIAFTIDPRGRLWVVENYAYPIWLGGPEGKDRILIF